MSRPFMNQPLLGALLILNVGMIGTGALADEKIAHMAPAASAEVYFISPHDGDTVRGPVTVQFGLKGMGVAPAGVKFDNSGHHHLLIDTELSSLNLDIPIPASDKVLHFGKGQTETSLNLTPGTHTLEILFADFSHVSFNPTLHSQKITLTVK